VLLAWVADAELFDGGILCRLVEKRIADLQSTATALAAN